MGSDIPTATLPFTTDPVIVTVELVEPVTLTPVIYAPTELGGYKANTPVAIPVQLCVCENVTVKFGVPVAVVTAET